MTQEHAWIKEFPAAVTVCDPQGIILEMNDKAAVTFTTDGGYSLIGKSLFDCHPGESGGKLKRLLEESQPNVYTIEKKGVKKLIYQAPWTRAGEYAGFVEFSFEIPYELPHFVRG
jgi:transcriptional regulator with PAS, ATPase and Fis domain